jgi:hypothetical protein
VDCPFLLGFLAKTGILLWCFGGVNVVDCVVNVVFKQSVFGAGKMRQVLGIYF